MLISIDTLRADRLGCYGYSERALSPHIDELAGDGILFETHISSSPWTTPAHMSLMTSLHPSTHGVTQSFATLKADLSKGRVHVLPITFESQAYGIALPPGSSLRERINRVVLRKRLQPVWQDILYRYLG